MLKSSFYKIDKIDRINLINKFCLNPVYPVCPCKFVFLIC